MGLAIANTIIYSILDSELLGWDAQALHTVRDALKVHKFSRKVCLVTAVIRAMDVRKLTAKFEFHDLWRRGQSVATYGSKNLCYVNKNEWIL